MVMRNTSPLLSIIIATYNCSGDLEKTLDSFNSLKNKENYEIIIQDGNSSDDTLAVAQCYTQLPLHIESRSDTGIYDAWNRALHRISGEWVLFMGAGDILYDGTSLQETLNILSTLPSRCQYYSVPVASILSSHEFVEMLYPAANPQKSLRHGMCLPHQGLFHHKSLFLQNTFSTAYKIAGDYEFICQTLTGKNLLLGSRPCVRMVFGGLSSNMRYMVLREKEFFSISRKNFPSYLSWKILFRLLHWHLLTTAKVLVGEDFARYLADISRWLQKKPSLWTRRVQSIALPPLSASPYFALCIATVGRTEELNRLLTSLEQQIYTNFHIYLADQNSLGTLDSMLDRHSTLPMTRVMLSSKGVSLARNILLSIVGDEEIIAFPDDDCWYASNTLEQAVAALRHHPDAGAVVGKRFSKERVRPALCKDSPVSKTRIFKNGETYLQFFRAAAVHGILFDPQLGPGTGLPYGCGEDTDYLLEAYNRAPVWRCPTIKVFHPSPDTHLPTDAKIASYAAGRMFLLKKHGFPLWFRWANILYPLGMLLLDTLHKGRRAVRYRWRMFVERWRYF